jgi:hypothetical protein
VRYRMHLSLAVLVIALAIAGCGSSTRGGASQGSVASALVSATRVSAPTPYLAGALTVSTVTSTVPPNGDVNPYGIVVVPSSVGRLVAGDLLVSNFNDKANNQGTGTTIVQVTTSGKASTFAHISPHGLPGSCPGGVGLTTALSMLPGGYVVVGSLPTTNGKSATAKYGCLIVLNPSGHPVSTIAGPQIQGPWDMTAVAHGSHATLFVSMALNGGAAAGVHTIDNSTVVRITLSSGSGHPPKVLGQRVIADGIPWRDDPAALVIGPTGLALAPNGTLYVADTLDNRIAAISNATTRTTPALDAGRTISKGLHLKQPLGLTLVPNGDILATNAGNGNVVEITPAGKQLMTRTLDTKTGAGSLFGLVLDGNKIYYVDDGDNTVKVLQ